MPICHAISAQFSPAQGESGRQRTKQIKINKLSVKPPVQSQRWKSSQRAHRHRHRRTRAFQVRCGTGGVRLRARSLPPSFRPLFSGEGRKEGRKEGPTAALKVRVREGGGNAAFLTMVLHICRIKQEGKGPLDLRRQGHESGPI